MGEDELSDEEAAKLLDNADYLLKKYFHDHKFCLAYDTTNCSGKIIRSHIVSEKYLRNIAIDGHVYVPIASSFNKINGYEFKLRGVSRVCHINGFCKKHDESLFESFEKKDFNGIYEQIYDISFRALCREYFQKKYLLRFFTKIKDGYFKKIEKTNYSSSSHFKESLKSLKKTFKDLDFLYNEFKKYKKSGLKYLLIETSKLPISTTGVLFPILNAAGKKIQKIDKKQLGFIYNVISLECKAYILIVTLKSRNNTHKSFLESISKLQPGEKINFLLTYFLFNNDNVAVSPDWYQNLTQSFLKNIDDLMNMQVGRCSEQLGFSRLLNFDNTIQLSINKSKMIV